MDVPANGRRRIVVITGMSRARGSPPPSGRSRMRASSASTTCRWSCCPSSRSSASWPGQTSRAGAGGGRARGRLPPGGAAACSDELRARGHQVEVLFLDASRREPGPPLLRDPAPAPARARRAACPTASPGSASCWPTCASWPTRSSTPPQLNVHDLKRLVQARFGRAGGPPSPASASCPSATATGCRRRRTWSSTCGSCPTRTSFPSSRGSPGRIRGWRAYVLERAETQEFLDRVVDLCAVPLSRVTSGRGRRTSPSRSAAPAGSTGAWRSPRPWHSASAPAGRTSSSSTGTSRRSRAPAPGRPSEQALLHACYWCREAPPRVVPTQGSRWTPAGPPPISVLL